MTARGIDGIIFDKDGTLFDFNATWGAWARDVFEAESRGDRHVLAALADALGYDLQTQRFLPHSLVIAGTVDEIAKAALPVIAETSAEALIARFNTAAIAAPQIEAVPLAGFLDHLKGAGLALGVATNDAEAPARAHLEQAGVVDRFDFIAGFDSGFGGKPAPGQLLGFCDHMGLAPGRCVMVGDSTHDLQAGRAAGMQVVAVLTGVAGEANLAPHADVVLQSIAGLGDWLGL